MGQYDAIIKESIQAILLQFSERLTGIKITQSAEIKDRMQTTIEWEPDFLKMIIDQTGKKFYLSYRVSDHRR